MGILPHGWLKHVVINIFKNFQSLSGFSRLAPQHLRALIQSVWRHPSMLQQRQRPSKSDELQSQASVLTFTPLMYLLGPHEAYCWCLPLMTMQNTLLIVTGTSKQSIYNNIPLGQSKTCSTRGHGTSISTRMHNLPKVPITPCINCQGLHILYEVIYRLIFDLTPIILNIIILHFSSKCDTIPSRSKPQNLTWSQRRFHTDVNNVISLTCFDHTAVNIMDGSKSNM